MKSGRIIGIDVARALAIFGMILVNFKIVFGENGSIWLQDIMHLFNGKAAATFVVLAGVGLALTTNKALLNQDKDLLNKKRIQIIRRAILLFIIGLSYITIWPADILHFYGLYMMISLFFIHRKPNLIWLSTLVVIFIFPILLALFNYENGWNFDTLNYVDFWTFNGFIRHLFFNGFHPAFPWVGFMLFGIWLGRQDLTNHKFLKKALVTSILTCIVVQVLIFIVIQYIPIKHLDSDVLLIFSTEPMPPFPLYMINGIAVATIVLTSCILMANRFPQSKIIKALHKTGQLALTFYVAHVIVGMGIVEWLGMKPLGTYSLIFSVIYAIIFSVCCILFSLIWLHYKSIGPLEWVM